MNTSTKKSSAVGRGSRIGIGYAAGFFGDHLPAQAVARGLRSEGWNAESHSVGTRSVHEREPGFVRAGPHHAAVARGSPASAGQGVNGLSRLKLQVRLYTQPTFGDIDSVDRANHILSLEPHGDVNRDSGSCSSCAWGQRPWGISHNRRLARPGRAHSWSCRRNITAAAMGCQWTEVPSGLSYFQGTGIFGRFPPLRARPKNPFMVKRLDGRRVPVQGCRSWHRWAIVPDLAPAPR